MQAAVQYTTIFLADMSVHYGTDRHAAIKGSGGANSMRLDFTVHGDLKEGSKNAVLDSSDPFVKDDEESAPFRSLRLSIAQTTGYADAVGLIDHPTPVAASHAHTSRRTVYLAELNAVFVHSLPVATEAFTSSVGTAHPCTGLFCFASLA
jgi:hypothetical protein